jgi:ferredoxin
MSTEVYYFSGTGNSLAVARDLAEKLHGKLISIPSVIERESITTGADVIGIVFPVYYVGLNNIPLIVTRFVMKLENLNTKYIFAVCTYGGGAGPTLKILDEIIRSRGGRLAAGFGVQMPQNAFNKPFENREKLFNAWKQKKLTTIYEYVKAKRSGRSETDGFLSRLVIALLLSMMKTPLLRPIFIKSIYRSAGCLMDLSLPFAEVMPLIDRSYHADENCSGCGICTKVCPVHNIKTVNGKPAWQHRCENCLACINWCPKKAIHGYAELPNMRRYHHPEVKLSDLIGHGQAS